MGSYTIPPHDPSKTYWFIPLQSGGQTRWRWFKAGSFDEARATALDCWGPASSNADHGVEVGTPIRAGEHDPCTRCPAREVCINSEWEYVSVQAIEAKADPPLLLTLAHTCRTCLEPVLSDHHWKLDERLLVAEGCPRWHPIQASAFDCGGCRAESDALRKAHPRHAAKQAALTNGFMDLLKPRKHPEGTVDLSHRRDIRTWAEGYTQADLPFTSLGDLDHEIGNQAMLLLWGLLAELSRQPEMVGELARMEHHEGWLLTLRVRLLEDLYLALSRHRDKPDAVELIRTEWLHRFLDQGGGPVSRAWTAMSTSRRKLLLRSWGKTIRELLAEDPPEEVPAEILAALFRV